MPYKCPVQGCSRVLPTRKGLMGHLQMSHGIAHPSKYLSKGEKTPQTEHVPFSNCELATEVQPPEEYYEDPRATHLRVEKELLEREKRELQNRLMQYEEPPEIKHLQNGIDEIRERNFRLSEEEVNEKRAEKNSEMGPPAFPPLPPILPPPFAETLSEKIKKLSERELFR